MMTQEGKIRLLLAVTILCGTCVWSGGVEAAVVNPVVTTGTPSTTQAATTTKPTSSAAPTTEKFEPFPESQCHIPFWHNKAWHHTCVKYNDFGDYWCSLSANFTRDENWRRCRSPDLKRFQCHIPFEYQGKNHTECLPLEPNSAHGRGSHHGFWCAVVPKIHSWRAESTDWAYCEHKAAHSVAYLKAVGVSKFLTAPLEAAGAAAVSVAQLGNAAEASASAAIAAKAPVKSLTGGAASSAGSGAAAGLSAQATVGISVGVVCSVLAVVAVAAGIAVHRRRLGSSKDKKSLLQTREKGTYGGVEASD